MSYDPLIEDAIDDYPDRQDLEEFLDYLCYLIPNMTHLLAALDEYKIVSVGLDERKTVSAARE